jgi:hypothetical protein
MIRLRASLKWGGFLLSLGILATALAWSVEIMRPIHRGNAQDYWSSIWGVRVAVPRSGHLAVLSTEGLYLYGDAGIPIEGIHLWRVPEAEALAAFPEVVDRLAGDPSGLMLGQVAALVGDQELSDREEGLRRLRRESANIGQSAERMTDFVQASKEAWLSNFEESETLLHIAEESAWVAVRADRAQRWWANIVFEAIFLGGIVVFLWLPILWRRASRWTPLIWGGLPVVILLPYYFGYCRWAAVWPDPTFWGGALYPWVVCIFQPLGYITANFEVVKLQALSCVLEPLNQNPPSMAFSLGFTAGGRFIGLLGPVLLGILIGAAVHGGQRLFRRRKSM